MTKAPRLGRSARLQTIGQTRPNIPEFPEISSNINQAIDQIYNGTSQPKHALDQATAKSAKALGWQA